MANISIKKDFQDGEELFANQLNLNFATIEAGVNSANKIVWQDENGQEVTAFRGTSEEIQNRNIQDGQTLYNTETGATYLDVNLERVPLNKPLWQDEETLKLFRGNAEEVENRSVIDGQTLYNTETGETYLDVGDKRISTGAGNVVSVGEEQPGNAATKIWIDPEANAIRYQDENGEFKDITIKSSDTLPIGFVGLSPTDKTPYGWLKCDGSKVLRADYPELFEVIGTTYNNPEVDIEEDSFRLPNFGGRVPVGQTENDTDFADTGVIGGEKEHQLTIEEMPKHKHVIYQMAYGNKVAIATSYAEGTGNQLAKLAASNTIVDMSPDSGDIQGLANADYTGGDKPHSIMQPYIVQNFIIKAKQTVAVVNQTVNEYSTGSDKVYDVDYINGLEQTLYEGNLESNEVLNIDTSAYKRLLVTFVAYDGTNENTGGASNVLIVDLTKKGTKVRDYVSALQIPYLSGDVYTGVMWCHCRINSEKTTFKAVIGFNEDIQISKTSYYVSKIVGVK